MQAVPKELAPLVPQGQAAQRGLKPLALVQQAWPVLALTQVLLALAARMPFVSAQVLLWAAQAQLVVQGLERLV